MQLLLANLLLHQLLPAIHETDMNRVHLMFQHCDRSQGIVVNKMEEDELPPFIVLIFYLEKADNQKQQQQKSTNKCNAPKETVRR